MDDVLAVLDKLVADTKTAYNELSDAVKAKRIVETALSSVKRALEVSTRTAAEAAYLDAFTAAKEAAPTIYKNKVKEATSISDEYAFDSFLTPLLRVGDEEELYSITTIGNGWARRISVELLMDDVAGTIEDYATGIKLVRENIGVKEGRDPQLASKIWATKIYGKGPYYRTIKDRLRESPGLAPFWSLLNDGSKNVSMSSDIGGTPYPSRGGHHFVQNTEKEIRDYYNLNFDLTKYHYEKEKESALSSIYEGENLLTQLQSEIDRLSQNSDIMLTIAEYVGLTVDQLNSSNIIIAAEKVKRGEILTGRVEVGSGVRKRIRPGAFSELVMGFGE